MLVSPSKVKFDIDIRDVDGSVINEEEEVEVEDRQTRKMSKRNRKK